MIKDNEQFRFDIMDFGDDIEIAYLEKLEKEEKKRVEKVVRLAMNIKSKMEECGECEGCGCKDALLRWIDDADAYLCYDCYYKGMQQWGELYSYHGRRAEDIPGFIDDGEWEYLWEEEQKEKLKKEKLEFGK